MDKKENLKFILGVNRDMLKKLLDDITEDESLNTANGVINHIKWQTAHMAFYADYLIDLLGGKKILKDEWAEMYKSGNEMPDDSIFPTNDELRNILFERYSMLESLFENLDNSFLDEEVEVFPGYKVTRMNAGEFFAVHDHYHGGQIAMIRKSLGRERALG